MNLMPELWRLMEQGSEACPLPDTSSLDSITRQLPGGFYSTFRTYRSRTHVLGLTAHLDRLYRPAAARRISPSVTRAQLCRQLASLLAVLGAEEARVRIMLSTEDGSGMVHAAVEPFQALPQVVYSQGVRVVTTDLHRDHPALKSTAFINESQRERRSLFEQSVFEGLIVKDGCILEGLTSNFFYLDEGKLGTARRGVLNGVTRRQVLRLARECRMEVSYRALPVEEISSIEEAFLTSSSRGIMPIAAINDTQIGSGRVGEGTRRLMHAYDTDVEARLEPIT